MRNRPIRTFSPGEKQRVAVARISARPPDILLADEPTSSLDPANARIVMEVLLEAAAGKTLILVSHDSRVREYFRDIRPFESLVIP
jgi:ABC-type lipoprotein export system ATPase subunit